MNERASRQTDSPSLLNSEEPGHDGLAILDFLFTFSLGGGLVPEAFGGHGILSEKWISAKTWPSSGEFGEALILVFGVLTLTFSWYGYHDSIRRRPHRSGTWQGFARFQIDVVLILLYGALLMLLKSVEWALIVGASIYCLYVVWDLLEASEYKGAVSDAKASALGFAGFVILATVAWFSTIPAVWLAIIAILANVLYRIAKIKWLQSHSWEELADGNASPMRP